MPLLACSASLQRPVSTTEAATGLEQVTGSANNEFDPAVSLDATAIAYEVATRPDAPPHVEVMALKDVGSRKPRVTYSSNDTMGLEPAWVPDGSGLVFVSEHGTSRELMQTLGPSPHRTNIVAAAADPYFPGEWPALSPDGKRIAVELANLYEFESGWRTTRHFDRALAVTDLLGTGLTVLGQGTDPAWSPDGTRLAFARVTGGTAHVFVANADGTNAQQITEGPADDVEPAWSPDGRFIVFCSAHGEDHWTQANLFAVRPDGSGLVQLTEGDRFAGRPAWGRDGFIYFHANVTDRFHIWRVRPVGVFADG
jgi:Tol biopolymer transport system component